MSEPMATGPALPVRRHSANQARPSDQRHRLLGGRVPTSSRSRQQRTRRWCPRGEAHLPQLVHEVVAGMEAPRRHGPGVPGSCDLSGDPPRPRLVNHLHVTSAEPHAIPANGALIWIDATDLGIGGRRQRNDGGPVASGRGAPRYRVGPVGAAGAVRVGAGAGESAVAGLAGLRVPSCAAAAAGSAVYVPRAGSQSHVTRAPVPALPGFASRLDGR
jgi:hypothetical protein